MLHQKGARTPDMREARTRLSVNEPLVKSAVAAINFSDFNIGETTRWGNRLQADARKWMQRGGFGERGRISKRDAGRILAQQLAELSAGGDV